MYTLDELYDAIANAQRTIGNYTMDKTREWGSGSIAFYAQGTYQSYKGKYLCIYASPAWEQCDMGFDQVIDRPTQVNIATQCFRVDETGDYDEFPIDDSKVILTLTGNLQADVDAYYDTVRVIFAQNNIY